MAAAVTQRLTTGCCDAPGENQATFRPFHTIPLTQTCVFTILALAWKRLEWITAHKVRCFSSKTLGNERGCDAGSDEQGNAISVGLASTRRSVRTRGGAGGRGGGMLQKFNDCAVYVHTRCL